MIPHGESVIGKSQMMTWSHHPGAVANSDVHYVAGRGALTAMITGDLHSIFSRSEGDTFETIKCEKNGDAGMFE